MKSEVGVGLVYIEKLGGSAPAPGVGNLGYLNVVELELDRNIL